jgi:hypothetical protein
MLCHEVHCLSAYVIGSQNKISLVFTIFFVNENDHLAGAQVGNDFFCGVEDIWHSLLF